MGIKQHFAAHVARNSVVEELERTWSSTEGSNVIVFDGTNFLLSLVRHPQFPTNSIALPRLKEYRMVLGAFLASLLRSCPDAALHFLLDGIPASAELDCKAEEAKLRTVKGFVDKLECAEAFRKEGYAHRAMSFSSSAAKWLLEEALKGISSWTGGRHRIFWEHARDRDVDMATALHALKWKARLLFSDDSDFLLLFPGTVVPISSVRLRDGHVYAKPLSLACRCRSVGVASLDELLVAAFLVGSDFNGPIMQVSDDESWFLVAQRAGVAISASKQGVWQEALLALAGCDVESREVDAFLSNFDSSLYHEYSPSDGVECWYCKDEVAFGATCFYPTLGELDPILQSCGDWRETVGLERSVPLHPDRLLRAYASGWLSGSKVMLLRFGDCGQRAAYSDPVEGQPVAAIQRACYQRLVAYLQGPEPASWDDEDTRFGFPQAGALSLARWDQCEMGYARRVVGHRIAEVTRLKKEAFEARFSVRKKAAIEAELDCLRDSLVAALEHDRLVSQQPLVPSQDSFHEMWSTVVVQDQVEEEVQIKQRAANLFYLVTGRKLSTLSSQHQELIARCMRKRDAEADGALPPSMLLLFLCLLGSGQLLPGHVQQLCADLNVDVRGLPELPTPDFALGPSVDKDRIAAAALVLGDLATWLLAYLQDCFCLCGGQGLLCPSAILFDGGPVVLTELGRVRRGSDGYKLTALAPQGEMPPDEVLHMLETQIGTSFPGGIVEHKGGHQHWIKVTGVSGLEAFSLHRRIVVCNSTPYIINVSALQAR